MRTLIFSLALFLFILAAFPHVSRAQMPFGGLSVMEWPCICLPPFEPIPPAFIMHMFAMFFNGPVPLPTATLLTAVGEPLLFSPTGVLHAGAWALGSYTPAPSVCGIIYIPPVPPVFPGLCIVWPNPILGVITPMTGTSI